ncbi:TonB-dependent receptor [Phaeobacter sp. PT47_59]|uniref:TonB-dependent receptor n=1 Tax=Phaeobacter sp. PT47_59 TaxID=3029979 RepID=UPI0023806535|nr:TonB-dependent receptor [Phaeobacter sp. PT47_59]MDE4176590.1 TonB-dependent receptor [Phaeobacter sp. PT47_59]
MRTNNLLLAGSALTTLFAAAPLAAQEADGSVVVLDPIVVTAYRSNSEASAIPGTVQVITSADLEDRIATGDTLEKLLSDLVPGLSVSNGTVSGASQTLRGRNIQILINGVARTSELRGFDRELALINPNSVERIEIIKGSNAQFGNGATGGTINIVTKQAGDVNQTEVITRLSAQDEDPSGSLGYELFLAHDRRLDNLGLRLELNTKGMGDRYDGAGRQLPSDPLVGQGGGDNNRNYALGIAADYTVDAHRFDLSLDVNHYEQTPEFFSNYLTNPVGVDTTQPYTGAPVKDETNALTLKYQNSALAIGELEVQAYATDNSRQAAFVPAGIANPLYYPVSTVNPAQNPLAQSQLNTETYGLRSTVRSQIGAGTQLTWGLDLGRDDVRQTLLDGQDVIAPMTQNSVALFAQVDAELGDFELSGGLRYERFDLSVDNFTRPDAVQLTAGGPAVLPAVTVVGGDFEYDAVVFNLGAVYHLTPATSLFAGFSQGFSLPDVGAFTRRAMAANPFLPGQTVSFASIGPDAQIVDTFELGLRHSGNRFQIEASAFYAESDEGTVFDSATNTITQQREETWGAEAIADFAVNDALNLGIAASFTEGRTDTTGDGSTDSWLPNNRIGAPIKATLYGDYIFANGLRLAGEVVYTGERGKPGVQVLEETTRVNLRMAKNIGPGEFSFAVDNLFNTDQLNPTGTSVRTNPLTGQLIPVADEGRRFWIGYSMTF